MEYAISKKKPFAKLQLQQPISYNINNDGIKKSYKSKLPQKPKLHASSFKKEILDIPAEKVRLRKINQ